MREEVLKTTRDIMLAEENVRAAISAIDNLGTNIAKGEGTLIKFHFWHSFNSFIVAGPKIDSAVQEALRILDEMKLQNLTEYETEADNHYIKATDVLESVKQYQEPIYNLKNEIEDIADDNKVLSEKLDDLLNHTKYSLNKAGEADNLYARNRSVLIFLITIYACVVSTMNYVLTFL